ncbi:MAG: HypC/HybG/HupF family hydrogenase formation chaperone [Acidobacteriota bacterium]
MGVEVHGRGETKGCGSCSDAAVPVRVLEVNGSQAVVEDRFGRRSEVAVDFVPEARPGDVLLTHLGVAIGQARETHEIRG